MRPATCRYCARGPRRTPVTRGLVLVLPAFPVKTMEDAVGDRGYEQPGAEEEHDAGVEREEPREQLATRSLERVHRPHASEQHRRVQEGITPGQVLEVLVAPH